MKKLKLSNDQMEECYQQGDILFIRSNSPLGRTIKQNKEGNGQLIIAKGEASGHAHVIGTRQAKKTEIIQASAQIRDPFGRDEEIASGPRYLVAEAEVTVKHDEHKPLLLPPGTYRIGRQREYEPSVRSRQQRVVD